MMTKVSNRFANPKTWALVKKYGGAHLSRRCLTDSLGVRNGAQVHSHASLQTAHSEFSGRLLVGLCLAALVIFNIDALQAIPLDTLREPMKAMKKEVWSYMFPVKIAAAVMGLVMSAVQANLMPLGVGLGVAAGVHFFDGMIGDGSAALIGF